VSGRKAQRSEVITAEADALVEVELPRDHPVLPPGAPVYCSSSQAVKREYRHGRPKPGSYRTRRPADIRLGLTTGELAATAVLPPGRAGEAAVEVRRTLPGPFTSARDLAAMEAAVRGAFDKLGPTGLELRAFEFRNEAQAFVPVSRLNPFRREL